MKLNKVLLTLILTSVLLFSLSSVSAQAQGCAPDGMMECQINANTKCQHRTCTNGEWGSWVEFTDTPTGSYSCANNPHAGGGQKCHFFKELAFLPPLAPKFITPFDSPSGMCVYP